MRASGLLGSTLRSGRARVWSGVRPEALGFEFSLETVVVLTKTTSLGTQPWYRGGFALDTRRKEVVRVICMLG
jgi:hypothetical protein